jgi:hypothetical protein
MSQDYKVQQVITMLGCSEIDAKQYLDAADWDVVAAIESNLVIPIVSGTKHIPAIPIIDDGLTEEVRQRIKEARIVSDAFTASFRNDLLGTQSVVEKAPLAPLEELAQPEVHHPEEESVVEVQLPVVVEHEASV